MKKIVDFLSKFFDVRELVSPAVYDKHQTGAWRFFDPRLLETLLVLRRDILRVPLVCNNWRAGGNLTQRGLRENVCEIVRNKTAAGSLYLSAHTLGMAVDLSSPSMTAEEMRRSIKQHADALPYPVRIEKKEGAPTWLHIDVAVSPYQQEKIHWF